MWLYILVTVVTIALAWNMTRAGSSGYGLSGREDYNYVNTGTSRGQVLRRISLVCIFVILFCVSAFRLNVGNDYARYAHFMHLANSNAYVPTEIGFNYLAKAIYYISGYENYILVFAVYAFVTILLFMTAIYDLSESFQWSFAMFMLLSYYFQTLSTVRYYLALAAALYSIRFIRSHNWPAFVLTVIAGACFHKSLLVILILYPLCRIKWKRWMIIAGGCLCLSFLFLPGFYLSLMLRLYPSYEGTDMLSGGTSLISIARCVCVLALCWIFRDLIRDDDMDTFYVKCNILALAMYVFCSFIPVISRIGYYLTVTQILLVPSVFVRIDDEARRKILKAVLLISCIAYFAVFLLREAPSDGVRILPYQTFFFHDMVPMEFEVTD